MGSALRYFIGVTLVVLLCVASAWVYFRGRALSEAPKRPFDHPLLNRLEKGGPQLIAYQGASLEFPGNTMPAFEKAASLSPDMMLWVDARPTVDGVLVAFESRDLAAMTEGNGWVQYTTAADLEKLDAGYRFTMDHGQSFPFRGKGLRVLRLQEVLKAFPTHSFVINFRDYKQGMDVAIEKLIEEVGAGDRVLITSTEDGILRDLREQRPQWAFGTSQAQGTRLLMFSSIGLEATIPLQGDVFMAVSSDQPRHIQINDRILNEVRRRKLKVIAGPFDNMSAIPADSAARNVDAVLLRDAQ
ncbi:MAG TPA: glycerophosphodiester phosphodiesterase family protein [Bdellovibrionales bacterium]|nr:glycerophosphodiester phosphodiesterase family protein [Bdellovibrionales bacterium]